ncbi:hypothetical protein Plhal304r1_c094g0173251 [Plasmopara halstedii]
MYQLPRARYALVLETGGSFARIAPHTICNRLCATTITLCLPNSDNLVGQLSKLPGGNLRLKVKTRDACMKLERQAI